MQENKSKRKKLADKSSEFTCYKLKIVWIFGNFRRQDERALTKNEVADILNGKEQYGT